jgi:hypothetical protein
MVKQVPFIANSSDNKHCVNAVFRMVYNYFFHKDISFEELDRLTCAVPGKATWTFVGEMEFAKMGLEVVNIEPVDYDGLYKEGAQYLKTVVGEDSAKYYLTESNINDVLQFIPEYLNHVRHETRRSSRQEIIEFIKQGYLIGVEVNMSALNHTENFDLHFILVYDYDEKNIIAHDPGLPPVAARKITFEEFDNCYSYEGANQGATLFRKKLHSLI